MAEPALARKMARIPRIGRAISLRRPLGSLWVNTAIGAHGPADTEGEDWASRYFAWRMSDVTWPAHPAIDDAHNLLALLHGQQVYHHANEERCDRISRRLHWIIGMVFFISLAGAVLELVELWPKLFNAQGELRWGLCGAGFGGFDQACLAREINRTPVNLLHGRTACPGGSLVWNPFVLRIRQTRAQFAGHGAGAGPAAHASRTTYRS